MEVPYSCYRLAREALYRLSEFISALCKHMGHKTIRKIAAGLVAVVCLVGCEDKYRWDGSLEALMASRPEQFADVLEKADEHRIQIIYTQIDRDADNTPSFRSFSFRLNADEYFYPASTVKLPAAVLALEKVA